jgi:hypothetical protein
MHAREEAAMGFSLGDEVRVADTNSPFLDWVGEVKGAGVEHLHGSNERLYSVRCSYRGWGENVLDLTFREEHSWPCEDSPCRVNALAIEPPTLSQSDVGGITTAVSTARFVRRM